MVLPHPSLNPALPERPPQGGWYWNSNHLARAWLPLIGPEGLGLLDFYLALADYRPGAPAPGWTAVTLDELVRLTGWGRARLVRLNRLLVTAGLLAIRHLAVPGRGPAVRRALYRVQRQAGPPTATTLARLVALAEHDPTLAARLRRYTEAATTSKPASGDSHHPVSPLSAEVVRAFPVLARPGRATERGGMEMVERHQPAGRAPAPVRGEHPPDAALGRSVSLADPVPVSSGNRSKEEVTKDETTMTTRARAIDPAGADELATLATWAAANGRPATPLEGQRLSQLALGATRTGQADTAAGWRLVAAAIEEAVEAGSAFVAPRRIARILERWQIEGAPALVTNGPHSRLHAPTAPCRCDHRGDAGQDQADPTRENPAQPVSPSPRVMPAAPPPAPVWQPPPLLPGLPAAPAAVLRAALAAADLLGEPYLRGAALAGWGETPTGLRPCLTVATLAAAPPAIVARLTPRLGAALGDVLGRPVDCALIARTALAPIGSELTEEEA